MTQAEALASISAQLNQQAINTLSENLASALVALAEIDELKAEIAQLKAANPSPVDTP